MSKIAPWFRPDWRAIYARQFARMKLLERLAILAGRSIRPKREGER